MESGRRKRGSWWGARERMRRPLAMMDRQATSSSREGAGRAAACGGGAVVQHMGTGGWSDMRRSEHEALRVFGR